MPSEEIQKVLEQVAYLVGQMPEQVRELSALSVALPTFLKSKSEELAELNARIAEAKQELQDLLGQIANAKQKHAQLEASQKSLNDWMSGVKGDLEGALSLPQARG